MILKKILRYAVIGAKSESLNYSDMCVMFDDVDKPKSRLYALMSNRADDDAETLKRIFAKYSTTDITIGDGL